MARCLYCGKTLWLRRSLHGSEFCVEEHRQRYDELVLARLQADGDESAVPAEPRESSPQPVSEPVTEAEPMEGERVPAAADFREIGSVAAPAAKNPPRQPARFREVAIARPGSPEVRRRAHLLSAPVRVSTVSPAAGVLHPRPDVEWKRPAVCLEWRRAAGASACAPRMAKVRGLQLANEFISGRNSRVLARGEWSWRRILPIHWAPVIGTVIWETPRPARLLQLRVAPRTSPCAARHPLGWTWRRVLPIHSAPAMESAVWKTSRPARLMHLRVASQSPPAAHHHPPVWIFTTLGMPGRQFACAAWPVPANPHPVAARPRNKPAGTLHGEVSIGALPIVPVRLHTKPEGLPVVGKETDFIVELEPRATPRWSIARVRRLWSAAPRLVRVAALLLPLLGASVPLVSRIPSAVRRVHWHRPALAGQIETALQKRAVLEVVEDFRSGLSGWEGGPGWSDEWSYDPAGFVRPGPLALLTASRALADYRFEFLGLIENKGIGWVFRAADLQNYYAMKIVIVRPGPLARAALVRDVVTAGVPSGRVQLPLSINLRTGKFYRIETSAYQDRFVTSINGRVVDTFFDRQHRVGGVGLFREAGEDARVMSLRVADRDDFLGRFCAYFLRRSADSFTEAQRPGRQAAPGASERK